MLRERGDLRQAKELYEKAVDGMRVCLGDKHLEPKLQNSLDWLMLPSKTE